MAKISKKHQIPCFFASSTTFFIIFLKIWSLFTNFGRDEYGCLNEGDLVACFEKHILESVIDHIASLLPMREVLRDSCFDEAKEKMNFFEIFKQRTSWSEDEIRKNVKVI